jgi:hypothetical protein
MCLGAMLFKFATNEDCQAMFWRRKGLARTKLSLDEDLTPAHQACKLELWPLFKEAEAKGKRAFWCTTELFINGVRICPLSSI